MASIAVVAIQSVPFPTAFLRMDGSGVTQFEDGGAVLSIANIIQGPIMAALLFQILETMRFLSLFQYLRFRSMLMRSAR
jgi:hypothetical protein